MSGPAAGGARPEPLTARTTVSVVVPVLDDADHLRACLALLARQTRRPDEVVVVEATRSSMIPYPTSRLHLTSLMDSLTIGTSWKAHS